LLSFFRINDPYRLLGLLILFLLITLPVFINSPRLTWPELNSFIIGEKITEGFVPYAQLMDSTPILTQWVYSMVDWIAGRSLLARHIFAFVFLFIQACYVGITFINKKAFTENTYVPSLIFILLCTISFDTLSITGTLLASGFLLLAINSIFKEIEFRQQQDESILKLGIYLSLASLAEFSFIIFFVGVEIILLLFTRASVRKHLLMITGFLLPHLILAVWAFYSDKLPSLWQFFYRANFSFASEALMSWKGMLVLTSVPLFYFVVSFFILNRAVRLTNYQSQLLQTMLLWLLIGVIHLLLAKSLRPQTLLPLFPPLSFLMAHFLLAIRRKRFAELHTWIFIIGIVLTATASRMGYLDSVNYSNLLVKNNSKFFEKKRMLVLINDASFYEKNILATGFCEWRLTEEVFEHPEYYENVLTVQQQFADDMPEIILDPNKLMKPFFVFLPELGKHYARKGDYYFYVAN
jgi:4-amino-4-deoxy-L-arabinose transferase-like glycosyltransferase